MLDKTT